MCLPYIIDAQEAKIELAAAGGFWQQSKPPQIPSGFNSTGLNLPQPNEKNHERSDQTALVAIVT